MKDGRCVKRVDKSFKMLMTGIVSYMTHKSELSNLSNIKRLRSSNFKLFESKSALERTQKKVSKYCTRRVYCNT